MSAVFDLNGCKERIRSILSSANTTTATYPLSDNMDTNVAFISKFNPDMVFNQVTQYPSVHIYSERKSIDQTDISLNQLNARRNGVLELNILGICAEYNIENNNEDKGQKNCEILMENIELNLRANPNLQSFSGVRWQRPRDVQYGIAAFQEDAYFRTGVMTIDINIFY